MKNSEICRDKTERRRLIRAHRDADGEPDLNGIDYVEVDQTQHVLTLFFLGKAPEHVRRRNVVIEGGVRVRGIRVVKIRLCKIDDPERDDCLKVFVDRPGDFSTYTLKLVNAYGGRPSDEPLDGFDPRYAQIEFSFKANCSTDLDCQPQSLCAPESFQEPEINYLAKDYATFRQLILDRLALIMPDWKERHVPDLGIALVEILAYTGDYLSYYQDAVATEAYLETARQRISVRRHTALVDYQLHEGSNARTWVCVEVNTDLPGVNPEDIYFTTRVDSLIPPGTGAFSQANKTLLTAEDLGKLSANLYEVFEPLVQDARPLNFYRAHNAMSFYTWHDTECCLPRGTTSATLIDKGPDDEAGTSAEENEDYSQTYEEEEDEYREQKRKRPRKPYEQTDGYDEPAEKPRERALHLKPGDVLIFEEVLGPNTGDAADRDPSHRHAVRLTKVSPDVDPLTGELVVQIEWSEEDALPFSLCISSLGRAPDCSLIQNVSLAFGNVLLCDHGRRINPDRWTVPPDDEEDAGCVGVDEPRETNLSVGFFRPKLSRGPLTHRVPLQQTSSIARRQAKSLNELLGMVVSSIRQALRRTRKGELLTQEQLHELTRLFGERALAEVGLVTAVKRRGPAPTAEQQSVALERLMERADSFLKRKRKRLSVLRRRALAGYALTDLEHEELREMFGPELIDALGLESDLILGPASLALEQNPREAVPWIVLRETPAPSFGERVEESAGVQPKARERKQWTAVANLLGSGASDRHFVAEVDDEGFAHLRFGNNDLGRAPDARSTLEAEYRIGQGRAGNVGAESIAHLVMRPDRLINADLRRVRNPLPARGGTDPEPASEAKLYAPTAFRKVLQRAITTDDYASLATSRNQERVQQSAASMRWTGSWYEVEVAVDPRGLDEADAHLLEEVSDSLATVRRMGHDLSVRPARYVPLDIELVVCVQPQYLRGRVKAALSDLFSNRRLPNGELGLFHPDNLTFGDDIYLSKLVAAAQAVAGVESVTVKKLERLYEGANDELANGVLPLDTLEVARLDSDPNFPERGKLALTLRGGR